MTISEQSSNYYTFPHSLKYYNQSGTLIADQSNGPSVFEGQNFVSKGDPLPGWRKLIADGKNATTLMTGRRTTVSSSDIHVEIKKETRATPGVFTRSVLTGKHWQSTASVPSSVSGQASAKNQSLINFYRHLQAEETAFKGLVFAGELRESLSMIRHPARALRRGISRYLSDVKRHRRLPANRRPSAVRRTWLEYSFGWMPLISDIDSGIRAFYSSDLIRPIHRMVRGSGSKKSDSTFYNAFLSAGFGTLRFRVTDCVESNYRHYGVYSHSGNGLPSSLHHYGFRPNEFVPTLWELIPYSFLVDYFTNIGGILESWSYRTGGANFVSQGSAIRYKREMDNIHLQVNQSDLDFLYTVINDSRGSYLYERVDIERLPDIGSELPSLELRVPGNWKQWTNIAALSANLSSSRAALK